MIRTISTLLICLSVVSHALLAQSTGPQIGINVVPLLNRTIELNTTFLRTSEYDFFIHGGYSLPTFYPVNTVERSSMYSEGTVNGAYLRAGARAYLNKTGALRMFAGAYVTVSYLAQTWKSIHIINCFIAPCPALEASGSREDYLLSAGLTTGVRTKLSPRLTLDLGVQANRFVFEKPDFGMKQVYVPGYGRQPFQGTASLQYTLKSR